MNPALPLPEDLRAMLHAVRRHGRPRIVGGGVRDWLLGLPSKDLDVEVGGVDFETLHRDLEPFGATDIVGRSFGVIKVRSRATGEEYDFPCRDGNRRPVQATAASRSRPTPDSMTPLRRRAGTSPSTRSPSIPSAEA
jgi:hypothetical protein